jgi:hypothetical protein
MTAGYVGANIRVLQIRPLGYSFVGAIAGKVFNIPPITFYGVLRGTNFNGELREKISQHKLGIRVHSKAAATK